MSPPHRPARVSGLLRPLFSACSGHGSDIAAYAQCVDRNGAELFQALHLAGSVDASTKGPVLSEMATGSSPSARADCRWSFICLLCRRYGFSAARHRKRAPGIGCLEIYAFQPKRLVGMSSCAWESYLHIGLIHDSKRERLRCGEAVTPVRPAACSPVPSSMKVWSHLARLMSGGSDWDRPVWRWQHPLFSRRNDDRLGMSRISDRTCGSHWRMI